jgi:5'-deoxynucleotidase YfbR-like HD superfamily hydrolase
MARYVFKPLITYFSGDPEEKKFDFIRAYKDSLTSGELLVDLYNYEIYVASNGMEYPIPSTPELRQEIIDYIESDDGPLGSLSKNDLLNTESDDSSEANITRKKEKLESLMEEVKKYNEACIEKINSNENSLKRINRETANWYNNLSRYVYKQMYTSNVDGSEIVKVAYNIINKYIDLYKRLYYIDIFMENFNNDRQAITAKLNEFKKEAKDLFVEIANNQAAVNQKLDKSEIMDSSNNYKVPEYTFNIDFDVSISEDNISDFENNINSLKKIDGKIIRTINFNKQDSKIKFSLNNNNKKEE